MNKEAGELLKLHKIELNELPAVLFEDGVLLKNPSESEVAEKIGLKSTASGDLYDVVIVGAGPAGLAAAVYGGSEGLKTLLIEKKRLEDRPVQAPELKTISDFLQDFQVLT